ncbi:MAG TPA: 4-(cytidine 5'-diphospho)-2-C-methyl-D-erythritol kinase [Candidatus Avidesulfovibrio excrementigallinarum]|nr:4-(cytidine 5'-diphospho)-2-C-methyl-D-erythritol kinase [Candidatus Avidesulfovibrio excrementigallinarum]
MPPITLRSGCKINLGLHIVGVRSDGMHLIDSLFWPLAEPHDELILTPRSDSRIVVRCDGDIDPEHNTLTRAHARFEALAGGAPGVDVTLVKGVPSGAGLGGGSADAATLLLWLNGQVPQPLPGTALADCAAAVGADVPFFLHACPCRVQGIGERITPMPELTPVLAGWGLLLLCPNVHVSTPWAYGAWDRQQAISENNLTSADSKDRYLAFRTLGASLSRERFALENDLEEVVFKAHPELERLKASLLEQDAACAAMSGSGSALFGLFPPSRAAACHALARQWNDRGVRALAEEL